VNKLPLFPVTTVGSWPRSPALQKAFARRRRGQLAQGELDRIADDAVKMALVAQEAAGCDIVTDGEQRRDNFYSFVADKLDGVLLMSLAEMLDVVEDKEGFRRILDTLDVPAFSIHSPVCVGKLRRKKSLAADEYAFLRRHTSRPIKVPLPGPYLLTRAMWVKELTRAVYPTKEDLGADVVAVLREEVCALRDLGVDFIQLDEPVLAELVFAEGQTRTFMCAALSARKDPAEELEFAVELLNAVVRGLDGVRTGLHVCRGNWSQNEGTLLAGSYRPLLPYLRRIEVNQLVLEYATPRAGDLVVVPDKEIGLGVVNPRTAEVEPPEAIVARVKEALRFFSKDQIFLNPDCGFATFASRPMNSSDVASAKLESVARAAAVLREGV
jgi:5-methyltetrahydropteroyltriglutamate--homocysteine methyltransferase